MSLIDLDRQFSPYRDGTDIDAAVAFQLGPVHTWSELLKNACVVVLGEAGTGKTVEFRSQATKLQAAGSTAFYVKVEDLPSHGLDVESLDPAQAESFAIWCTDPSKSDACFFLDSVDESKLKGDRLETALRRVIKDLKGHGVPLTRCRFVISCRVSDWTTVEDSALQELASALVRQSDGGPQSAAAVAPLVVQLRPLDEAQLRLLCAHFGVVDVDEFMTAVRAAGAWPFFGRPFDVERTVEYWTAHRRFGSWQELIEYNIERKLEERPGRGRTQLTPARARKGAAMLAAACVLTTREGILVLDPNKAAPRADSLDPRQVLTDWSNAEIQQLLGLALFDEATYGRVRFHHRSVREYLAATHIRELYDSGCATDEVEAALFPYHSGRHVIASHLTAIALWLAPHEPGIRRRLLELGPEHLIDEGDPSLLPEDFRLDALRAYAEKFGGRENVYHHFDDLGLRRFATPALEPLLRDLIVDTAVSRHVRDTALRLVAVGRLGGCAAEARSTALETSTAMQLRRTAASAYASVASEDDLAEFLWAQIPPCSPRVRKEQSNIDHLGI